jgi:hypothetical protein
MVARERSPRPIARDLRRGPAVLRNVAAAVSPGLGAETVCGKAVCFFQADGN